MHISRGLFAGITPAEGEVRTIYDRSGQPVLRDGVPVQSFGVHQRTPYVLEKFSPLDGYGIEVVAEPGAFDLPDPDTYVLDGQGRQQMANQPTVKFTARLVNAQGRTLATASYLKVINSLSSHQEGETLARGRLYEALGLPGATHEVEAVAPAAAPKATTVSAVAIGRGIDSLPAQAKDIQETAVAEASASVQAEEATASEDVSSEPVVTEPAPVAAVTAVVAAAPQPAPASPATGPEPSLEALNGDALAPALVRQAVARARSKGVTLPAQFDSAEHLRLTYRELCTTRKPTPTAEEA